MQVAKLFHKNYLCPMSIKKDKIHSDLIKGIQSTDDQVVLATLEKVKSVGSAKIIPELLQLWFKSNGEIQTMVMEIMYSIKDKNAIPILFEELENTNDSIQREKILSVFWNAGMEVKDHLSELVNYAIQGDFMEAVECLTIIENMEPPLPEDQLMECLLNLKEYFSTQPQGEKVTIIRSIATFIQYTDDTQVDL